MKIRKIHITNYRGINELQLEFATSGCDPLDLVVLAGPNGCGKTSVLEACLFALKQDKLTSRSLPEQDYRIEIVVGYSDTSEIILRTPRRHDVVDAAGVRQRSVNGLFNDLRVFYFSSWRTPKLVGSVGLSTAGGKGRGKRPARTDDNKLWRLKQKLVNLKGSQAFDGGVCDDGAGAEQLLKRINDAWRMFYPELDGKFDAKRIPPRISAVKGDELDELSFDLFLTDKKRPQGVSVDDLSSGEIEVISMIGMFVIERKAYDIVFLDEPELHLHPAWHRAILPALKMVAPETQFICATHSADLLDAVYSFERFTLLEDNDPRLVSTSSKDDGEHSDD